MTFELHIKCVWQHPAMSYHLEIPKIEWSEIFDPNVITAHSLRQLQPGNWKTPNKAKTEAITNLLSALQEIKIIPDFKKTLPLTRHLVKELFRQCQSSVSDQQTTSSKRNKLSHNSTNSMIEVSHFQNFALALFWWNRLYSVTLYKNLDVVLVVLKLILWIFSSHFVLPPTKRRLDITAFSNSFSSEKIEWPSTWKTREVAIYLFKYFFPLK